jgi:hypothetical protein
VFLLVALALTMVFGMAGWLSGCATIQEYRTPTDGFEQQVQQLPSAEDRDAARVAHERYQAAMDANKSRQYPLGVAEFLLGAAMMALTVRTFAGRTGARSMLLQVTAGQAVILVVAYFMTRDARDAFISLLGLMFHLSFPEETLQRMAWSPGICTVFFSSMWSTWIFVRTLLSAMAIVLLTRKQTTAFTDAGEPVSER